MLGVFRWLVRLVTAALVLGVLAAAAIYWIAGRSLPDYDRDWQVAGLGAEVEIVRTTHAVPHVFGDSDADVFFGLGFAHAQDRLWQMLMLRRTVQGRLSELFGTETLATDDLLRRLDLYGHAERSVDAQDPQVTAMLEAYSRGVNAWLRRVGQDALGRGAPEMFLFEPQVSPWRPADSIAVMNLMALQLAGHQTEEVLRARTAMALRDPDRLADILPDAPGTGTAALPDYAALAPGAVAARAAAAAPDARHPLHPVAPRGLAGASNAWAAAPERAATGAALLANDPHLGLSAPSIWYLARLELGSGGVIGGTIPGMPVVLVGRNDDIGWGLTSSYLDDIDLYLEEVNPQNSQQYRTPDGWAAFETSREIIRIADAAPVTITLRRTENGPVLTPQHFDSGTVLPAGHVMAMRWTALSDRNTSMRTALELMRAATLDEAVAAGRHFVAPSQMLTVADGERVGMVLIGHMPWRDAAHATQGRMPAPGHEPANRWLGILPYSTNPRFLDPEGGIVGNTNNEMLERDFPLHVSHDWGDSDRVRRWERLMQVREVHTRESFIEAQLDAVSPAARQLLPLIARELWFRGEAAPEGTPERRRQRALDLLAEWNGEMNEHLPEPLIYAAWMRELMDRLIRDDIGPLADAYTHPDPVFLSRVFADTAGASVWCDIRPSAQVETCTDIARMTLDAALQQLVDRYGPNLEAWRWGAAHVARHDHQVLGEIGLLGWFVNIRQPTSGGDQTLRRGRTAGTGDNPFANVHAAGYRGVYDFADPDSSVFVIATGQSGHPLSPHYDDLGALWRRGEYIQMQLDPALARAGNAGVTRLIPDPG